VTGQYEPPKLKSKKHQAQKDEIEIPVVDVSLDEVQEYFKDNIMPYSTSRGSIRMILRCSTLSWINISQVPFCIQVNGKSGIGKSTAIQHAYSLFSTQFVKQVDMTGKAKFNLPEWAKTVAGLIFYQDDKELNSEEQEDFRRITTKFQDGMERWKTSSDGKVGIDIQKIPPRIQFTISCVDSSGNEQTKQRFHNVYVIDTPEKEKARNQMINDKARVFRKDFQMSEERTILIKCSEFIRCNTFGVDIPYALT